MIIGLFLGAVAGLASAACSVVSGFASAVGSIVMSGIGFVSPIFSGLGKIAGMLEPNETIESLGEKALHAPAEISPEHYKKYDDFLADIRKTEIDIEKNKSFTLEQKQTAGVALIARGLDEKYHLQTGTGELLSKLVALEKGEFFTPERVSQWLGESNLDKTKLLNLFDQKLPIKEAMAMENLLVDLEKQSNPNKTEVAIRGELISAKDRISEGI